MPPASPAGIEERDRKAEHIRLALDRRMQLGTNVFDVYRFEHEALPEIDYDEIDTSVEFLGRRLAAPLLISCMTGGTEMAWRINRNLATGAEATGVAIGVGSQRKALEDPAQARTFQIRARRRRCRSWPTWARSNSTTGWASRPAARRST
jgi:isopentenyl-diphosphate delta-isomerase